MKKILSIALIAALVATSVFAVSISGQASLGFDYELDTNKFGFANNGEMNKIEFKFAEEFFKEEKEVVGEGDIYAGIKASLVINWEGYLKFPKTTWNTSSADGWESKGELNEGTDMTSDWKYVAKIEEAYITNGVWKFNILGSKSASDYAISAIDSWDNGKKFVSAVKPSAKTNPGFVFTMDGYTASLGMKGSDAGVDVNAMVETKEYDLDGAKVQLALVGGNEVATKTASFGASVQGSYSTEDFTVFAASDVALSSTDSAPVVFNADAVAKFTGYGVTVDAYYAVDATDVSDYEYNNKNLLSAKVAYKTTIEDVEVDVDFTGLDLVNTQDLAASATAKVGKVSGTVYGGYIVKTKGWKAGASATYTEVLYTVEGAVDTAKDSLTVSAKVSSDTLVAGAQLEAGYKSGNLLADPAKLGTISASATIKF